MPRPPTGAVHVIRETFGVEHVLPDLWITPLYGEPIRRWPQLQRTE